MSVYEPGSFLAELTVEERGDLLGRGRERRVERGETLFVEGESTTWVAVLLSGTVKACSYGDNGIEVVLAVRGPGALLGEVSAIDGLPRSATVSALERASVRALRAEEFMDFLHGHSRVSVQLMRMLCQRWRDADRKRIEFGMFDTTGRVAQRLVELAERYSEPYEPRRGAERAVAGRVPGPREPRGLSQPPGSVRITLNLTQEELAGWVGASREAVSKALRTLRGHGWIETGRRRVIVHDLQALRRHAR
ncbi:cAMP-binding domain of CRP or a regulatory subunit of cAMP-dependent protein kinases [Thermomonospora echinospora]|uniref:cAMP-binding domain of CRP or a regulatory subunit of cAMP-dependent protein kinases n=1 Tax=Thermomonospora echinospora TaxID=1992 RepID=A0A1H6A368_9ACTN|nr:Crp/Fnr family transcriptional regulator [Thermomonospora echinospora]SEG43169.1 cAMP-binding domain of CRP or a regulatory subunit of cAMP-dependent protein kinases [Thermomonospora echinospora]